MKEETKQNYISQAIYFFESRLGTGIPHVKDVQRELINHAFDEDYPGKNSWYRKRAALKYYYESKYRLDEAILIGTTLFPEGAPKKKTLRSIKKVSQQDFDILVKGCMEKNTPDTTLACALIIVKLTGCRPSEMMSIKLAHNNGIIIKGAKKTENGMRGLDRELLFDDEHFKVISTALTYLRPELERRQSNQTEKDAVGRLQRRLDRLNKKLFPKRKRHITFKSFRHQLGSDLKSSGLPRTNCAAILGHQSVNSINKYGDRRSGKGKVIVKPSQDSINNVRVNELSRGDFKQHLVNEGKRKPSKSPISPTQATYSKINISASKAYYL